MMHEDHRPAVTGMPAVKAEELEVWYGHANALQGVAVEFHAGKINAIVGPNGAGKSSLLLAMYGAIPSTGRVFVNGQDISTLSPSERAREGIGFVPQGRQIFPTLTVRENLSVFAEVLNVGKAEVDNALGRFQRLEERSNTLAGNLSGGEQQMLAVARALMTRSSVLLFDEMATGLAPLIVEQLLGAAKELADEGATVVLAEASIGAIRSVVDRGYVLMRGAVGEQSESGGADLEERYRHAMGISG